MPKSHTDFNIVTLGSSRRFVLIDRDGTLNIDKHYFSDPELLELVPGAAEGLGRLQRLGCGLVVVTNQSGVGRRMLTLVDVDRIHERLREILAAEGVTLDAIYVCPHHPDEGCRCRKPLPGMVEQAVAEFGFDPKQSFVVGDKRIDMELGRAVGATTLLVRTGHGLETAQEPDFVCDYIVDDLGAATEVIAQIITGTSA